MPSVAGVPMRSMAVVLLALALVCTAAQEDADPDAADPEIPAALSADEACTAEGSACALAALQSRAAVLRDRGVQSAAARSSSEQQEEGSRSGGGSPTAPPAAAAGLLQEEGWSRKTSSHTAIDPFLAWLGKKAAEKAADKLMSTMQEKVAEATLGDEMALIINLAAKWQHERVYYKLKWNPWSLFDRKAGQPYGDFKFGDVALVKTSSKPDVIEFYKHCQLDLSSECDDSSCHATTTCHDSRGDAKLSGGHNYLWLGGDKLANLQGWHGHVDKKYMHKLVCGDFKDHEKAECKQKFLCAMATLYWLEIGWLPLMKIRGEGKMIPYDHAQCEKDYTYNDKTQEFELHTRAGLQHKGYDCWSECGEKAGKCHYCGKDGLCCRKGHGGDGCSTGRYQRLMDHGCFFKHCCVHK